MIVCFKGELVALDQACVSVSDRGLLLGDGVFETIFYDGQELECFEAHWQRLCQALTLFRISFEFSQEEVQRQIMGVVKANGLEQQSAAIRLTVTRGVGDRGLDIPIMQYPNFFIQAIPYQRLRVTVTLGFSDYCHPGKSALSQVKHLGYQLGVLGRLEAQERGVDDVIFLNAAGHVVGTTAANLFTVVDDVIVTPPVSSGCLPGVKRAEIIQHHQVQHRPVMVRPLLPEELLKADSVFLTNSLIGRQQVCQIRV